jgi:hypothetical protein
MVALCSPGIGPLASALLLGLAAPACCVEPPRARDLLALGFRTPEQTFATFQTAVRADDPGLERRCLSADFVARNGLSGFVFLKFWEDLEKDHPFLRKGIADARLEAPAAVGRTRARIAALTHGRRIEIELVREDFCEAWSGGEKKADEAAPFGERTGVQDGADGSRWIYGRMPLPEGIEAARITELRFGREWKIDGFEVVEPKDAERKRRSATDDIP